MLNAYPPTPFKMLILPILAGEVPIQHHVKSTSPPHHYVVFFFPATMFFFFSGHIAFGFGARLLARKPKRRRCTNWWRIPSGTLQHLDDDEMLTYVCSLSGPLFSGITLGGSYTLWLFNMAMENGPFTEGYLLKMVIFHGYVKIPDGIYIWK